jgi:spore maturation protein CgeB
MKIAFYGSSLLSSYWNGAATYYRGLLQAVAAHGHEITFFEPDAYDRQAHRDIEPPAWAKVEVYPATIEGVMQVLDMAGDADVVVKASGVGVFDTELLQGCLEHAAPHATTIFWDVDAPATLAEMAGDETHPIRTALRRLDLVLTYGGGQPVIDSYEGFGARRCIPIYNALDPATHHPVPPIDRFRCDLAFLGNRLPDRERRVDDFFLQSARQLPQMQFLLGGSGWEDHGIPPNVRAIGHVGTQDHNAFNCSARAVLNIARDSMAAIGFSPATRVFEAAGAGACLITDAWEGIELFLEPGREVLVARDHRDVAAALETHSPEAMRRVGEAARQRILAAHTYAHRALQVDQILTTQRQQRLAEVSA